jgi:hypothetical protein
LRIDGLSKCLFWAYLTFAFDVFLCLSAV